MKSSKESLRAMLAGVFKLRRYIGVFVVVLLLLSGCGKKPEAPGLYDLASGVPSDAVLLTVNGKNVPAARYFYWLTANCDYLAKQTGGIPNWDMDVDGKTLGEYVKDQALSATVFYAVVEGLAAQHDCVVTDEDLAAINEDWAAQVETYGGEDAYLAVLAQRGLDQAGAQLFSADYYLYEHLRELAHSSGSALAPAEGVVEDYAAKANLYTAKVLRCPDTEKAKEVLAAMGTDPACDPASLVENSSDYETITAAFGDGTLPVQAESVMGDLSEGNWSQAVDTGEGVYLVSPAALDMEDAVDLWFESHMQQLAADATVECGKDYDQFTAESFYKGLLANRKSNP